MGSVGQRDNLLTTPFRWFLVPKPAPRETLGSSSRSLVMLDVIWLLGVVVLFLLLALCVKGVDAL